MDHACYKCGAMVEEGAPFCPECRAPQIRVRLPGVEEAPEHTPDAPATPPFPPGTPGELQPPAQAVPLPAQMRLRDTLGVAAPVAILMIVCWALLPAAIVLAAIGGGILSVVLYARRRPEIRLNARMGARVGMMSGLLAFAFVFFMVLFGFLGNGGAKFRELVEQWARSRPANDPTVAELMRRMNSPESIATLVVIMVVIWAIILIGLSSLGGAVGAKLLRRKHSR